MLNDSGKMSSDLPVLEPLSLSPTQEAQADESAGKTSCLLCDECYDEQSEKDQLLKHLLLSHHLVIADVKLIANLKRYLDYWRPRFRKGPLTEYCSQIRTNSKTTDPEPAELYYLLCDALPEDKEIRTKLQKEKLDEVLAQQQKERIDNAFSRKCLFCKQHFNGNRADLFDHMVCEHNFSVGKPDNLVYTTELLDLLDKTLHSLQCLYCEKIFKDRHVLKEHMRKKQHKKINPKNKTYDQFYVINYLELGKNWESFQNETDPDEMGDGSDNDEASVTDDWSEWQEPGAQIVCLYCQMMSDSNDCIMQHMKDVHLFDFHQIKKELKLSFYQQVKLINYIRRQIHQLTCPVCEEKFDSKQNVLDHLNLLGHASQLPSPSLWDQPQYLFPTYENDSLLCGLEDGDDDDDKPISSVVMPEDCPVINSVLLEKHIRDELLS